MMTTKKINTTIFLYTLTSIIYYALSQNHFFSLESNITTCYPRKLEYDIINRRFVKFISLYEDFNESDYYLYKEEGYGFECGISSQLKLLKYWNGVAKLKYGRQAFTAWHKVGSKIINTPEGDDKIFQFNLDQYAIHTLKFGAGINMHYNNRFYVQILPYFNFPIGINMKKAIGEYGLKYSSPSTSDYSRGKNTQLDLQRIALGFETEVSAKIYKSLFLFCNYTKVKDLYREKSNNEIQWDMRNWNVGLKMTVCKDFKQGFFKKSK